MLYRRVLATLVVAPLFVLSACGGGDTTLAEPPVSGSPASTPASSAPTSPPRHETVEHFIRRWAQAGTRMQNTGDTNGFLALSRDCQGCRAASHLIAKIYQHGGSVSWQGWRIRRIEQRRSKTHHFVDLYVVSAPTSYRPSRGAPVKELSGGHVHYQVQLKPADGSWTVTSFVEIS